MAAELGYLPPALAQAAAVIAGQHLAYGTYLERLRALPVAQYLTRDAGQPYPHGVAEAVLLYEGAGADGGAVGGRGQPGPAARGRAGRPPARRRGRGGSGGGRGGCGAGAAGGGPRC